MGFILPLYQLILTQNYCSLDVYHASSIISRLQQWWICLWSQIWPAWPGGCTRSVGTHLGSSVSASEAWDRWCQPGLGPRAGQGSRDEQSLIYAAAPDRGPECRGLPLRSWPWLAAGSSIGRDREGGGGVGTTNGCLRKGGLSVSRDWRLLLAPWAAAGSVQHVWRKSRLLNTFHLNPSKNNTHYIYYL